MWEFKQIQDLHLRIVALAICSSDLYTRCEARPDSPLRECGKSMQFVKDLKGARLNGGVQIE